MTARIVLLDIERPAVLDSAYGTSLDSSEVTTPAALMRLIAATQTTKPKKAKVAKESKPKGIRSGSKAEKVLDSKLNHLRASLRTNFAVIQ